MREHLTGYEEVPDALDHGLRRLPRRGPRDTEITYHLSYGELEGDVAQAHIHFGHEGDARAGSARSCAATSGTGRRGRRRARAPDTGEVSGTIEPAHVVGPAGQGIAPGEYNELLRAIRAGATYANVHSTKYPGGRDPRPARARRIRPLTALRGSGS